MKTATGVGLHEVFDCGDSLRASPIKVSRDSDNCHASVVTSSIAKVRVMIAMDLEELAPAGEFAAAP